MMEGFIQFNNSIINEISNFTISSFDLLFISGPRGSAKSESVNKAIPMLKENNLVFQLFCFENSAIDDFLLNFYDSLRTFSQNEKYTLKKIQTDSFKEKVSHYFKTIESDCIVIVENFEKVDDNIEIIDFLSHIAKYDNVKIIIVAKEGSKNLFRFKKIKVKTLEINSIDKESFKTKLAMILGPIRQEFEEEFYEISSGLELYLTMTIKYCSTTGINVEDLIEEFKRKQKIGKISFEEFLVNKLLSLIPNNSKKFYKTLCLIRNSVSIDFIQNYNLGNINDVSFLAKNFLLIQTDNEFYVKDYFKKYIIQTFSIQEKISYFQNLIEIFDNELTKSPKDRLLRLSREAIRKEIEYFKKSCPTINIKNEQEKISYLSFVSNNWHDDTIKSKSKLAEKFQKIKERKEAKKEAQNLAKPKQLGENSNINFLNREKNNRFIKNYINSSIEYTKNYLYNDAIEELLRAKKLDRELEFDIEITMLIAKNYTYLNNIEKAMENYDYALKFANDTHDSRVFEIKYSIALINKNLYKTDLALEEFQKLARNEDCPNLFRSRAYVQMAEIYEGNFSKDDTINSYFLALELANGRDIKLICKIYYKLGLLFDENQDFKNAIKYYQKNYLTSAQIKENKYYSASLVNLASIYIEQSNQIQAIEYLKLALDFDTELNDIENMYYEQKELAKIYINIDRTQADYYFSLALNSAKKSNNKFNQALLYFELAELFYDLNSDKEALIYFLNAKKLLNKDDEENLSRISQRIKDIKARVDNEEFGAIINIYDR